MLVKVCQYILPFRAVVPAVSFLKLYHLMPKSSQINSNIII